jgi:hypothetical protein
MVTDGAIVDVGTVQRTLDDIDGPGVVMAFVLKTVVDEDGNNVPMVTDGTRVVVGTVQGPLGVVMAFVLKTSGLDSVP